MPKITELAISGLGIEQGTFPVTVDVTILGSTELVRVPPGKQMIVTQVIEHVSAMTFGGKAVDAVVSYGGNASTYDDYIDGETRSVSSVDKVYNDTVEDAYYPIYDENTSFRISVDTASDADAESWDIYVFGYFIDKA